jgi:hypothetical protein
MKKYCKNPNCDNPCRKPLWLLAIADRGMVVCTQAHPNEDAARKALVAHLRKYNGYKGTAAAAEVRQWLENHDKNLDVKIVRQNGFAT